MSFEQTLVLIKPDAYGKGDDVVNAIIERYTEVGLKIRKTNIFVFSEKEAGLFYREHKGKSFFEGLIRAMTAGASMALLLEGEGAVATVRHLNGPTNPAEAPEGTIRGDFSDEDSGGPRNVVHGSDSVVSAKREIGLIFC